MHRLFVPAAALAAAVATTFALGSDPAPAAVTCAKVASPTGSDTAAGTASSPYRTAQRLVDSLASGQVGCLAAGTYSQDVAIANSGITLTAVPGEQATLVGRLWIKQGANTVTVTGLKLNGKNASALPSPTVNGNDAAFVGNDITNDNSEICFLVGSSWGRAQRTLIQRNRIHGCGRIPSSNQDHGIYVSEADDTRILDNVIFDNVDRGIQLYPDAQRTVVRNNIIDGNGEGIIFSGASGLASGGTVVENNIISNAQIRTNVESWYPSGNPVGQNNVVRSNCIGSGAGGSVNTSSGGFTLTSNVSANPTFVNRAAGDFRLQSGSACASLLSTSVAPADASSLTTATSSTTTTPTTTTTTTTPTETTATPTTTTTAPSTTTTTTTAPATTTTTTSTTPTTTTTTTTTTPTTTTTTTPVKCKRWWRKCYTTTRTVKATASSVKPLSGKALRRYRARKAQEARHRAHQRRLAERRHRAAKLAKRHS